MKATVIVPTLNEEKYVGKCLESLKAQTVGCDIIVVDSGSVDKTVGIAEGFGVRVLTGRKGIAYNRQLGLDDCLTDIVVSTDADCVHPPDWLERLLGNFTDDVVAVSGPTVPMPEEAVFMDNVCYYVGNQFLRFIHLFGRAWFRGSNTAYRRKAILDAGGYDINLVAREDSDLSRRVARLGRTVFDNDCIVYTSMRRRREMGWVRTIRYYLDTPVALVTKREYYRKI